MKKALFFVVLTLLVFDLSAETAGKDNILDYKSIKKILKNDMLDVELDKKRELKRRKIIRAKSRERGKYQIPGKKEYWSFFSEYWLVKNAQVLKWDFEKPDYGLKEAVESLFEKMGFFEKKFKLLLINTSTVSHFGLPASNNEYIFIVSLPFVRTMDLSKLEIAMIVFEDLVRLDQKYFADYLGQSKLSKMVGKNFHGKKLGSKDIKELLDLYDKKIFDKGFNFKQQFEVTRKMDRYFKSDLSLWHVYLNLKKKINNLVKSNVLYSGYAKIYPSPELQINWLSPKKREN